MFIQITKSITNPCCFLFDKSGECSMSEGQKEWLIMGDVLNAWSDSCLLLSLHPLSKWISRPLQRRVTESYLLGKREREGEGGRKGEKEGDREVERGEEREKEREEGIEKENTWWTQDLKNAVAQKSGNKTELEPPSSAAQLHKKLTHLSPAFGEHCVEPGSCVPKPGW